MHSELVHPDAGGGFKSSQLLGGKLVSGSNVECSNLIKVSFGFHLWIIFVLPGIQSEKFQR